LSDNDFENREDGCLIVMEGIDGSGKTTQCRLLAGRLEEAGREVVLTREPTDGPWGRKIREHAVSGEERLSLDEELDLFVRDRREHVESLIEPAMARGAVVITDRYYFSTMAYQGARGADVETIREANEAFAPKPDVLLYLRLDPDNAGNRIDRGREGRDVFEGAEYQREVARQFDALDDQQLVRIRADQSVDQVADDVWKAVTGRLGIDGNLK
jgi:dTMP kinase